MKKYRGIFLGVFFYSVAIAAFIQLILIPRFFPQIHAGHGLIKGHDWVSHHIAAVEMAEAIKKGGWKEWHYRYNDFIESSLGCIVYLFTGIMEPWILIPINALIHACSAVLILMLFEGFIAENLLVWIFAAAPFILFPTSLIWVGQIHKDGLAFFGNFLFLFGLKRLTQLFQASNARFGAGLLAVLWIVLGAALAWLARRYLGDVLTVIMLLYSLMSLLGVFYQRKTYFKVGLLPWAVTFALPILFKFGSFRADSQLGAPMEQSFAIESERAIQEAKDKRYWAMKGAENPRKLPALQMNEGAEASEELNSNVFQRRITEEREKMSREEETFVFGPRDLDGNLTPPPSEMYWKPTRGLPKLLEDKFYTVSRVRYGYSMTVASSNIDSKYQFRNVGEFFSYLPRAIQVILFAPFPRMMQAAAQRSESALMRQAVNWETYAAYFLFPFFFFQLYRLRKKPEFWAIILPCGIILLMYSYCTPNLGTLHRYRYGFLTLFWGLGGAYLVELIQRVLSRCMSLRGFGFMKPFTRLKEQNT